MSENPAIPMRIVQASLGTIFALLLFASVAVFLIRGGTGLVPVISILAGALILSAILPMLQEFTIGPKGITGKLQQLRKDVEVLKFLVSGYVTASELEHLKKLAGDAAFYFDRRDTFVDELRRLWQHGLIKKVRPDWYLATLPGSGNLKDYLVITDRGKRYLELLEEVEADKSNAANRSAYLDA